MRFSKLTQIIILIKTQSTDSYNPANSNKRRIAISNHLYDAYSVMDPNI